MMVVIFIIYAVAGYWATGKTIYANKIIIEHKPGSFFVSRVCWGMCAGIILIPWAIIKCIIERKT